ncbi:MAG: glycosyltransferase [Nitrosomonadales bacterium]|nr:glycosyltransferase [Nitrosomonadales bacterium]
MSTWLTKGEPVVSICCATFNHVGYLEDALRGFLAQVTSFPFEILVRDDASTDGTADIVRRYAANYPHIIRPVLEQENQFSQGVRATPVLVNLAKGEYLALCEGDDYWITNDKLEKQVQLLRDHPGASMSVARTVSCEYDENRRLICQRQYEDNGKNLQEFDDLRSSYFHTSTYVIRSDLYREALNKYSKLIQIGDFATRLLLVADGPFVLLKEVVSIYRYTGKGMWSSMNAPQQKARLIDVLEGYYQHLDKPGFRKYFGGMLSVNYLWMFLRGKFAFNNNSAYANLRRFMYFTINYGIPGSAIANISDIPVSAMGGILKRFLPDAYWKYLQTWRGKFRR